MSDETSDGGLIAAPCTGPPAGGDAERRRDDQAIGVGFGDHATTQAATDATRHTDQPR